MHFQKHDMVGTHYRWAAESDRQIFSGQPSRRTFDRDNGDQVLFLINFYGSLSERFTIQEGRMIEKKITDELPLGATSELSVFHWISNSFAATAVK